VHDFHYPYFVGSHTFETLGLNFGLFRIILEEVSLRRGLNLDKL